ncbi:hypothetical protein ECDEC6E_1830 [Escherichia coli DEC6E]|nr:hypothetical protein ECDEC6D_2408 [Escherichia coli DEC6D]EHV75058.1 hypothetical protein ECDEC6E_1830 [Escherichia coli DEC6E]
MFEPLQSQQYSSYIWLWHERDAVSFIVFTNILPFSFLPAAG